MLLIIPDLGVTAEVMIFNATKGLHLIASGNARWSRLIRIHSRQRRNDIDDWGVAPKRVGELFRRALPDARIFCPFRAF
ncbi:MAG: hypothetical protein LBQ50_14425 [Planctomycetaceae bacterium]|nr:hypothetical protein [Planctomycetaceae bacterium]